MDNSIRERFLSQSGSRNPLYAATNLALELCTQDPSDPWKQPYEIPNAVVAAAQFFPEVDREDLNTAVEVGYIVQAAGMPE